MDIYNAILKAADHIERQPKEFNFMSTGIPHPCGSPGCALGWVGYFVGRGADFADVAKNVLNLPAVKLTGGSMFEVPEFEFYNRVEALVGTKSWKFSAVLCAQGLRLYAAKYHAPKPQTLDWETMASVRTVPEGLRSEELA